MASISLDSGGSGRVSGASLDASLSGDDASLAGDDGGALDALWRFEEAHHCLLNQQLARAHAPFVDDLYAALEAARDALEQQSVRVLAVLHDKDVRIQALETQASTASLSETVETATQATPRTRVKATQCDATSEESDAVEAMRRREEEQSEQIEVLLDELERLQRLVEESKTHEECREPPEPTRLMDNKAVQTDTPEQDVETASRGGSDEAWTTIGALQAQLDAVERSNSELRAALAQRPSQESAPQMTQSDEMDLDAVETQLQDAIRAMETASLCQLNPLVSAHEDSTAKCLDLDHRLRTVELERDSLSDQLLALRATVAKGIASRPLSSALVHVPLGQNTHKTDCSIVSCQHTLRRLLRHIHVHRNSQSEREIKKLRREIRHALRGHPEDEAAAIVARIAAEWMHWETGHVEEVEALRRGHVEQRDAHSARIAKLVDHIHGLNQRNVDLQTELKVLSRQRTGQPSTANHSESSLLQDTAAVDDDRRVLVLEQSLLLKQEQLDLANRAVRALSSGVGSQALSVRFTDQDIASGHEIVQHRSSLPTSNAKSQIAELTMELQALKERDFRRFQPASTSQHAVVEYFRLEKECLRLRCRLKDKDDRIQQLELQCEQLEQNAKRILTTGVSQEAWAAIEEQVANSEGTSDGNDPRREVIERYYSRMLEKRNEDLWIEMTKAKSRIAFLQQSLTQTASSSSHSDSSNPIEGGTAKYVSEIAQRVEDHHRRALEAFQAWQQSSHNLAVSKTERYQSRTDQPDHLLASYGVVLGHYETLALQLRLLQNTSTSDPVSRVENPSSLTRDWQLLERIHALENSLLEAQACLGCGEPVVKKLRVKKKNMGTTTVQATIVETGTQMNARDRQRLQLSKSVQVDLGITPFQFQESRNQTSNHERTAVHAASTEAPPVVSMVNEEQQSAASDSRLHEIQGQLEESLARIEELTSQKEKLKDRLEEARRVNRRHAKEEETLRSQVAEVERSNASLSNELQQLRQSQRATESNGSAPEKTLAVKEQENRELVRQLCESKEKYFQVEKMREDAERRIQTLERAIKDLEAERVDDRNKHLEEYMTKVNQSLASIERDKERLTRENQELQRKLQQIEIEAAMKEAKGTRTSATETDATLELDRLRQLPEHQTLETRVVMLENALETERRVCEELRAARETDQREKARLFDAERSAIDGEKATLRRLIEEISAAHESLQHELTELQSASAEAKEEADKRIQFLTACVEECSRLVDSTVPNDEVVTARDIYDTIVTLSTKVGTAVPSSATTTPRRSKSSALAKPSEKKPNLKPVSVAEPTTERTEKDHGLQLHSQLQAETWRVRAAKFKSSLRAASLKNKTFEEMVDHLEIQMDALKGEVKDRMTKESALLTKQGQMKVEIANLKAQNRTLTSRLAEACGELKRSQDATKGTDGEVARLRSALQRKTELLTRQKSKCEETQKALDQAGKRIAQLEAAEKSQATALLKQKDQALQLQELRQQWTVSRDANFELRAQTDKQKDQLSELQSRVKALRLDNAQLRDQLRTLKKAMREQAETAFKSHTADTATAAAALLGDGKAPANLTPTEAVDVLATQVKTLKRRVLQKQEVIVAYKTKLSELDAELTLQRTKLFELSQSYRQFQQVQREKELSMLQGATYIKDELEESLLAKAEQLDGLRASIFDACEVFVQCDPPKLESPVGASSSQSSSASLTWPEDADDTDANAQLLQELRRYADLSPDDLADLRLTSPKRAQQKQQPKRLDKQYAAQLAHQRGARVLQELEHALEVAPHDCREEICGVLEFLCAGRPVARRY